MNQFTLRTRLTAQKLAKYLARSVGLELRYAYQNPLATDTKLIQKWTGTKTPRVIIDVGANVGQTAKSILAGLPEAKVISFEPFPAAFKELSRLATANSSNLLAFNLACGDKEETIRISIDPNSKSGLNSLQNLGTPDPKSYSAEIKIVRLDDFCEAQEITDIDMLKTDTEGHDLRVLQGASRLLKLRRIKCIVVEVGFAEDAWHTPFSDVYEYLIPFGFSLAGIYEISYYPDGKVNFANACFFLKQ